MMDRKRAILYVHGKGGSAAECERYELLFPESTVVGLDYQTFTPWETGAEIHAAAEALRRQHGRVTLIANSVGAYFSLYAALDGLIQRAYFVSPVVDMEKLIADMMRWSGVSEAELEAKSVIPTAFGEDLSWEYLTWVRSHPIKWSVPTRILYGSRDELTDCDTVRRFAEVHGCGLCVMEGGEHWFHTEEQLRFLDNWIKRNEET